MPFANVPGLCLHVFGEIVTNATFHILCPWTVRSTCFALVKINKAEFAKSASTMICKILLCSHLKSIGILTALVFFS